MSRPSLLIAEPPLQVLPSLAKAIGLNEAIVLQQIQYWVALEQGIEKDGRRWIYNTVEEWRKQFPFWSTDTIQRTLQSLRDKGLIDAQKLSNDKWRHTLYYSINYNNLQDCITASCGNRLRENAESITADCNDGITAKCDIPLPQFAVIIPTENTQRLQTETTSENSLYALPQEVPTPMLSEPEKKANGEKAPKANRGTRISPNFTPSESMMDWAKTNCPGLDLLTETDKFCDYWQARAGAQAVKMDWQLTWKTWMRTAFDRLPKSTTPSVLPRMSREAEERLTRAVNMHKLHNEFEDDLYPAPTSTKGFIQ